MGSKPACPYDENIAAEICEAIATSNKGFSTLQKQNPHWPSRFTVDKWLNSNKDFAINYARSKADQAHFLADEIIEIADDTENDTIVKKSSAGKEYRACNKEWVNRSRLRVDARKWIAAKLLPKVYGDKFFLDAKDITSDELDKAKEKALEIRRR